jgi:hypothetical protein
MVSAEHRHRDARVNEIRHSRQHPATARRDRCSIFKPEIEEIADNVECARTTLDPPKERNKMLLLRCLSRSA